MKVNEREDSKDDLFKTIVVFFKVVVHMKGFGSKQNPLQ